MNIDSGRSQQLTVLKRCRVNFDRLVPKELSPVMLRGVSLACTYNSGEHCGSRTNLGKHIEYDALERMQTQ